MKSCSSSSSAECVQKNEADFYFLISDSDNINNKDLDDIKKFIIKFIETFVIGPQHVRFGLVKFGDSVKLEFDVSEHTDVKQLQAAVERLRHEGGGVNTAAALDFMAELFERAAATRAQVPRYLVVLLNEESIAEDMVPPAEQLRARGVITYAIGVKDAVMKELRDITRDQSKTFNITHFDKLASVSDDIITDVCSDEGEKNLVAMETDTELLPIWFT